MVVDPREIVAIETMMLAIDAAFVETAGDISSAYI
jgi:hypothetical protein